MSSGSKSGAACAKAKSMYGMRLMRRDYEELIASYSLPGIVAFLKSHPHYEDVLREADGNTIRRNALEGLIRNTIAVDYRKLLYYMADNDKEPLHLYMQKGEVEYILQVIFSLKYKSGGGAAAAVPRVVNLFDDSNIAQMETLLTAGSFSELLELLRETKYSGVLDEFDLEYANTVELETALYNQHMRQVIKSVGENRPKEEAAELRRQLGIRIDIENIRRMIRMQRYFPEMLGSRYVLDFGYRIGNDEIRAMVSEGDHLQTLEAIMPVYAQYYSMAQGSTAYSAKEKILLQIDKNILRMSDSALAVAIAYLRIKAVEVKNLYHIIEGIRYELPESEMHDMIIGISDSDNNNQ